ncbi:MAG: ABC transporter ATP-binding protein, partial [Marinirhabdus sp.]
FKTEANQIVALVGESGSGKSVTSLSILGLLPPKTATVTGQILFESKDLIPLPAKKMRTLRGSKIAMIFQEPMSALNPSLRCGFQVAEVMMHHLNATAKKAHAETLRLFEKVKLPRPTSIYNSYPHQLSGGQMQRVMIAMAIACKPELLIADEPTTALDVTVQKEILLLLQQLQNETGMSILFISHDLALVSQIADRVVVLHGGKIVEEGAPQQIFKTPREKYTRALLAARPRLDVRLKKLPTIAAVAASNYTSETVLPAQRAQRHRKLYTKKPLLEVKNLKKEYISKAGFFGKNQRVKAVDGVSFQIYEGETLGLVGESGCGKTTLGKTLLQLEKATAGRVLYRGRDLTKLKPSEIRKLRKEIQLIFQDPFSSLSPRLQVGEAIVEPMKVHKIGTSKKQRRACALHMLERVGLAAAHYHRYPHELSGGQRQRVGIARAIAMRPKLVVCDESVSALDISVQAQVLNLLNELKEDFNFTYIFISHDLAVVKYMADQLLVMNRGKIVEMGDADEVYQNPVQPYTQKLIAAIPRGIYG